MDNLGYGLALTIAGLGIVFGLLAILWLLLTVALRFERRATGEQPAPGSTLAAPARPVGSGTADPSRRLDPRLVAAITVAVLRHTEARRRQAAPAMRSHWPGSLLFASRWVGAGRVRQGQPWRKRGR